MRLCACVFASAVHLNCASCDRVVRVVRLVDTATATALSSGSGAGAGADLGVRSSLFANCNAPRPSSHAANGGRRRVSAMAIMLVRAHLLRRLGHQSKWGPASESSPCTLSDSFEPRRSLADTQTNRLSNSRSSSAIRQNRFKANFYARLVERSLSSLVSMRNEHVLPQTRQSIERFSICLSIFFGLLYADNFGSTKYLLSYNSSKTHADSALALALALAHHRHTDTDT